jgi:hypothetical protein
MLFDDKCVANGMPCPDNMTCKQGGCMDIENGMLVPFNETSGAGSGPEAGSDAEVIADGGTAGEGGAVDAGPDAEVGPCDAENGGCDADQLCRPDAGNPECLTCPSGSIGSDGACGPALTELELSAGVLSPEFDSLTLAYKADLPLLASQVEITATAASGVSLMINANAVESGEPWTTPPLPLARATFAVRTEDAATAARTYSVELERKGTQVAYLKASNADAEDQFGRSVAVSGDTVVVGAFYEDSGAEGIDADDSNNGSSKSGAVYVFDRDNSGAFQQTAYIKPDDTREDGQFGGAVDLDGDTLLVGAIGGNGSVSRGGAAYVFVREAGVWRQQAKLVPEDGVTDDWFGVTVALEGDLAIIGAPDRSIGAVYVYERSGDTWTFAQRFTQDSPRSGSRFGAAISLHGDRLIVGAPEDPEVVSQGGAAYVFARTGGTFSQTHELRPSSSSAIDWFGYAVTGDDDLIVVGAPLKNGAGGLDIGSAYVFARNGSAWEQQRQLGPGREHAEARFGSSVLIGPSGLLFVGAQGEFDGGRGVSPQPPSDDAAPYSGGVYVFRKQGPDFVADSYIKADNRGADDAFGYVLDATADLLVVGALYESSDARSVNGDGSNNARPESGAAYVFQ